MWREHDNLISIVPNSIDDRRWCGKRMDRWQRQLLRKIILKVSNVFHLNDVGFNVFSTISLSVRMRGSKRRPHPRYPPTRRLSLRRQSRNPSHRIVTLKWRPSIAFSTSIHSTVRESRTASSRRTPSTTTSTSTQSKRCWWPQRFPRVACEAFVTEGKNDNGRPRGKVNYRRRISLWLFDFAIAIFRRWKLQEPPSDGEGKKGQHKIVGYGQYKLPVSASAVAMPLWTAGLLPRTACLRISSNFDSDLLKRKKRERKVGRRQSELLLLYLLNLCK